MHYRLYFLDGANRIRDAADLDCADDVAAVRAMRDRADGRAMELWQGTRRVGRCNPPTEASGGRETADPK